MKITVKQSIEIIGVISVVASLIFVGMQLYFDRQIAAAEQYQYRAESRKDDLRAQLESERFIAARVEAWNSGNRPGWWSEELEQFVKDQSRSNESIVLQNITTQLGIIHFDNVLYQYNEGLIDEDFWQTSMSIITNMVTNDPVTQAIWINGEDRAITRLAREIVESQNQ